MSGELNFDITVQLAEAVASFDELSKKSEDLKLKLDELSASRADPRAELKDYELVKSEMDELKAKIDLLNAATASPDVVVQHIEETKVKLDEAKAKLDELGHDTANPDVSLKDAEVVKAEIDDLETKLRFLGAVKANPEIAVRDVERTKAQIGEVHQKLNDLDLRASNMILDIRTDKAKADIGAFATEMTAKINAAIKAIPSLELKADASEVDTTLAEIRAELTAMRGFTIKGQLDGGDEMLAKMKAIEEELKTLSGKAVTVEAKFNIAKAQSELETFQKSVEKKLEIDVGTEKASQSIGAFATSMTAKLDSAIKAIPNVEIKGDTTQLDDRIIEVRAQLATIKDFVVEGKLVGGDDMLVQLKSIEAEVKTLSHESVDVQAKFDLAKAEADLAAFRALVEKQLDVKISTDKASADIGAFAAKMTTQLDAAIKAIPDVTFKGNTTDIDQKIAAIKAKLTELRDVTVTGKFDDAEMLAKITALKAELAALSSKDITIRAKADVESARSSLKGLGTDLEDAKTKSSNLGTAVDSLAGTMSTKFGLIAGSIQPLLASIGQLSGAFGLLPGILTAVGTGVATVVVGMQGMSAAFTTAAASQKANQAAATADAQAQKDQAAATTASTAAGTGNIAVLKQRVAEGAAHVATLKAEKAAGQDVTAELKNAETAQAANTAALKTAQAASTGNADAIKNMDAAQKQATSSVSQAKSAHEAAATAADAQAAAMNNLAPAAQGVVSAILQLQPAFTSLRMDVQQHLFDGLKQSILDTANSALPVLKTGLSQMADAINTAVKNVAQFIQQQSSIESWKKIFTDIGVAATNLAGAVKPILQIITDVTQVGSQFLPQLAQHFADAAQRAADFVSKAKETGQLAQWIQTGIDAVKDLWDSLKNVVAIIKDLATQPGFGPNFLQALKDVTAAIRWITDNVPMATSAVQMFFDAWVFAKVVSGIAGMVSSIGTIGVAINGAVAKFAALTAAEGTAATAATTAGTATAAAGTAATGAAAGFSGLLLPLAALAVAVEAAVTHWQAFIQGFKDMGAVLSQGVTDVTGLGKAVGDVFTGDFAAAGRALDDSNKKFQDLRTQLNDHSGFDSAKQGADGLTASIEKTSQAMSASATAITGSVSAEVGYKAALDGVTTSVAQNTNTTDLNTAAGRNNVTAVANLISSAQQYEAAQKTAGASDTELTTLHNTLATSIQGVVTKLGLTGPEVDKMVAAFTAAKPALDLKATLDTQGVTAGVAAAKAALAGLPPSWQVKIAGEAADLLQKVSDAGAAIKTVPETHMTTFTGEGANLLAAAAGGTTAISGVVPDWLTKFAGDTANLVTAATTGEAALEGVKSTHGSSFTGDVANLTAAATAATTAITAVAQPAQTVFTANITDITTKTGTATTQIAAVAATHATTFTGDLTGTNGVTQAASTATTQINAIPATHQTTLTIDDAAALQQIQQFTAAINAIPTSHVTTLSTVQGAAGGGIIMKMAIGGIVPLAQGGYTPMSASRPAIVPPNTMRLIGDRPVGDEAFIPINNSGASTALLSETAKRMNYKISPMHGGGRSWDDDDDDRFWDWWRRGGGGGKGGGPSSSGSTLTPSAAATQQMYRATSGFQAVGGAASISSMKAYHQNNRPPPAAAASSAPPPVNIHCDSSNLGRLLFELFRNSIRAQGGNVQVALGS